MDTDSLAALRAGPSDLLTLNKLAYSNFLDHFQVFDHAHPVFCPVPFIQLLEPGAGEELAGKTKPLLPRATLDGALNAMRRFVGVAAPAPGTTLFCLKIRSAEPAVHPAGGDQAWLKLFFSQTISQPGSQALFAYSWGRGGSCA